MKKNLKLFLLISALLLSFVPLVHSGENGSHMLITSPSAFNYQQTRERLLNAISDNGLVLFGEFDHAKAAHDAALSMPPTTVLVFGNPRAGTPLMVAHPELALDLPFRVLISQLPDGKVNISYHPAEELLRYGLDTVSVQKLKKLEQFVQKNIQP
ncbi:TPA: DUF302 domain-containing protein [Salmonella enterica subsp. enterica serovar Mississippi]|nr:DUF302 domain-containing protein [Salmonella enterica subsp. enterica]ECW0788967.1 DUF302 domain-containing protein [Salmonella enterica subsp. enterica]HED0167904.1 DUF302 domain-containing protein [Salmonella enterica subsp. enterica serovar Mississippi]HED0173892.1 DUF302 domain-containing protein [Salmonella enterica subsp. enterica serovar Mississippi]HED0195887.1 DUF302 domain-containing protein [Salmonella enterica subsp. enterica serovar Mississippi]